ncbi:MAG: hypothetical protein ACE5G0_10425 [Rhodothermales bacterium]
MALLKTLSWGLLVLLFTGCTHTRHINSDAGSGISFDELHQTLEGRQVDIALNDERTMESTALRIRPDSTWSVDLLTGNIRGAATSDIRAITRQRPGRGALHGAAFGAVGGAIVGIAAGLALTSVRDEDTARESTAYYVSVITGFGVVLGIGSGTLIGMKKGSRDRYVYPDVHRDARTDSRPLPGRTSTGRSPSSAGMR